MDYFALLQEPRRPWLDPDNLKANFLRLAAQHHPDKIHRGTAGEKAEANQRYAELNAAYRRLLEPKDRLRHLLELETGAAPQDVQTVPADLMNLFMEVGQACRAADAFLAERAGCQSPLLKAGLFAAGLVHVDRLEGLRATVDGKRAVLTEELKSMNGRWDSARNLTGPDRAEHLPLPRVEELGRTVSYLDRWTGQIQERLAQLSF